MSTELMKLLLFTASAPLTVAFLRRWGAARGVQKRTLTATAATAHHAVSHLRKEYSHQGLLESDAALTENDPLNLFKQWMHEAIEAKVLEPNAMCLSTCHQNRPSARYVLLKGYDESGFVWFTNYESRKSQELLENPHAALTFWWGELERSVRIEGEVHRVSDSESETYFHSRPRGSQIGAWTSNQSEKIANREALEAQEQRVSGQFEGQHPIPRPPHWGGFRLVPKRVEFWKGRQSRLHDRLAFERENHEAAWALMRLQP